MFFQGNPVKVLENNIFRAVNRDCLPLRIAFKGAGHFGSLKGVGAVPVPGHIILAVIQEGFTDVGRLRHAFFEFKQVLGINDPVAVQVRARLQLSILQVNSPQFHGCSAKRFVIVAPADIDQVITFAQEHAQSSLLHAVFCPIEPYVSEPLSLADDFEIQAVIGRHATGIQIPGQDSEIIIARFGHTELIGNGLIVVGVLNKA